jgi:hypothetical protein
VDLSGNPSRPLRNEPPDPEEPKRIVTRELEDVVKILRPSDRVRLLTVDRYVRQAFPFVTKTNIPALQNLEFDGIASLFDGLAAALMQPVETARRHVIVARTKGVDGTSVLGPVSVRAIAFRADAQFHVVAMEQALDDDIQLAVFQCSTPIVPVVSDIQILQPMGLCSPTNRYNVPPLRRLTTGGPTHRLLPDGVTIKDGAESTGGGWHQAVWLGEPTLTGTFRNAFENFRSSYVVRYTPQGVTRNGWHTIDVSVPAFRSYRVNARRGYGIEEPRAPVAAVAPASNAILKTIDEMTAAYGRGAYQQVVASIRQSTDAAAHGCRSADSAVRERR